MICRRLVSLFLSLAMIAQAALAGDVRMYREGETPDPHEIAAMLKRDASVEQPIKFRSIRMLPAEGTPGEPAALAAGKTQTRFAQPPAAFALPVQFAFDSARILPQASEQLDAVADGIKLAGPKIKVVIEGHTDALGSDEYNVALSRKRAQAVKSYLVLRHGIPAASLSIVGAGKKAPVNPQDPFAPENRRVEFRADADAA